MSTGLSADNRPLPVLARHCQRLQHVTVQRADQTVKLSYRLTFCNSKAKQSWKISCARTFIFIHRILAFEASGTDAENDPLSVTLKAYYKWRLLTFILCFGTFGRDTLWRRLSRLFLLTNKKKYERWRRRIYTGWTSYGISLWTCIQAGGEVAGVASSAVTVSDGGSETSLRQQRH